MLKTSLRLPGTTLSHPKEHSRLIACGLTCSHDFKAGTVVTLTETPRLDTHSLAGVAPARVPEVAR